jgi:hypothetical protein
VAVAGLPEVEEDEGCATAEQERQISGGRPAEGERLRENDGGEDRMTHREPQEYPVARFRHLDAREAVRKATGGEDRCADNPEERPSRPLLLHEVCAQPVRPGDEEQSERPCRDRVDPEDEARVHDVRCVRFGHAATLGSQRTPGNHPEE